MEFDLNLALLASGRWVFVTGCSPLRELCPSLWRQTSAGRPQATELLEGRSVESKKSNPLKP
jgi:hypothetical protein